MAANANSTSEKAVQISVRTTRGSESETISRVVRTGTHNGQKINYILSEGNVYKVNAGRGRGLPFIYSNRPITASGPNSILRSIRRNPNGSAATD